MTPTTSRKMTANRMSTPNGRTTSVGMSTTTTVKTGVGDETGHSAGAEDGRLGIGSIRHASRHPLGLTNVSGLGKTRRAGGLPHPRRWGARVIWHSA